MRELMVCRTGVMGWHLWECDTCGAQAELFNSCKNRHCPKCQRQNRKDWAARLQADLLPLEYYAQSVDMFSRVSETLRSKVTSADQLHIFSGRTRSTAGEELLWSPRRD